MKKTAKFHIFRKAASFVRSERKNTAIVALMLSAATPHILPAQWVTSGNQTSLQPSSDSGSAVVIKSHSGDQLFDIDTVNSVTYISSPNVSPLELYSARTSGALVQFGFNGTGYGGYKVSDQTGSYAVYGVVNGDAYIQANNNIHLDVNNGTTWLFPLTAISTGQVGIGPGSTSPASTLQVYDASNSGTTQLLVQGGAASGDAGTNQLFRINQGGNSTGLFTVLGNGSVGVGTTQPCATVSNPPANCRMAVAGAIQAKEVVVNTGWSDYVFDQDYKLAPLKDVGAYVKENHHLPNIPSAADVANQGVSLGDMQSKLLAKIEELTLHMIAAEERNDRLEQQNRTLSQEIQEVKRQLAHE